MKLRKLMILLLSSILILLTACNSQALIERQEKIAKNRPPEATKVPDFTQEVTDIRITAVERKLDSPLTGYEAYSLMQIYYGYQSGGQWYDLPMENYDLVSWNAATTAYGYEAAGANAFHVVKIGNYLLVRISMTEAERERGVVMTDTLGTQMITPLDAYYTSYFDKQSTEKYAYFIENYESLLSGGMAEFELSLDFPYYYFLIVNMEEMTAEYELQVTVHTVDGREEWVLTYDGILALLG